MNNIDYTLWPNTDGNLGNIKVQIPTGIGDDKWPEGDVLVGNFVYKDGKLAGFVDTKALIVNDSKSTIFPYDYVNIRVDKSLEGVMSFNKGERTKYLIISYTTSGNGGDETFDFVIIDFNATDQETINTVRTAKRVVDNKLYDANDGLIGAIDTSKIEAGGFLDEETFAMDGLFSNMDMNNPYAPRGLILSEFNSDLSSLRDGSMMFAYCLELNSFSSNLPSLTDGIYMFNYCSNLNSFSPDLPSLTDGLYMFLNCSALTSFSSDLSSLTYGDYMFQGCTSLTSFSSDLPSLTNGSFMFYNCKLDASSVKNIIDTINTYSNKLTLGMGCNNTTEDKDLFAQEAGYPDGMTSLLTALQAKGWTVSAQYNGRPTTTYSLRRPSEDTLPVFVKLEETEEYADYTSEDGSKKFRLDWFHETTGSTEGYTQYATLEEAIEALNIKPIERN